MTIHSVLRQSTLRFSMTRSRSAVYAKTTVRFVVAGIVAGVVQAATPDNVVAQGIWSAPVTVSVGGGPSVATDSSGNAVGVWCVRNGTDLVVQTARFTEVSSTWSGPTQLSESGQSACDANVVMNGSGDAVAVWARFNGSHYIVQAARYSAGTAVWSGSTDLSAPGEHPSAARVAMDISGNAVAVWTRYNGTHHIVQAARYSAATAAWTGSTDLSGQERSASSPIVAMDNGGNAVAVWLLGIGVFDQVVQAVRYTATSAAWGPRADLSPRGGDAIDPSVAVDSSGNAIAVWGKVRVGTPHVIQSSRYTAATAIWSASTNVSAPGPQHAASPHVAMDSAGNAIAVWARYNRGIQTSRYSPVTGVWGPNGDLSAPGDTGVDHPTVAIDGTGNAVAAWEVYDRFGTYSQKSAFYAAAAGAWTGSIDLHEDNAPGVAIAIGEGKALAVWTTGSFPNTVVRAAHANLPATPSMQPAIINRPNVTLTWTPPASGPAPTAYTIVASSSPDGPSIASLSVGTQTSVLVQAPDGTYYVRVVVTVGGTTIPSNEIAVVVAPSPAPTAPLGLGATVDGSIVTLAWGPPANGAVAPVLTYVIEAGSALGSSNLANFATGSTVTSFTTPPVPAGSYYVRLRARNATGTGPATPDVRVVVGPPPPGPPTLAGSVGAGRSVSLTWTAPTTGAAVTGYQLEAGTAPGFSDAAVLTLPATPLSLGAGGVPPGTYYVRIVAASALGLGFASNEIVLVVP